MWNIFKVSKKDNDVFIVNFEHISHLALMFLLLTLSRQMPAGLQNGWSEWLIPKAHTNFFEKKYMQYWILRNFSEHL